MNIFGGFKEASDVSDANKEIKPEVSQQAQNKFEKLMGDENLPEIPTPTDSADQDDKTSDALNKFENLFAGDLGATKEFTEYTVNAQTEILESSPIDSPGSKEILDNLNGVKTDNYRLPRNGGEWSGEPGDSDWKPDEETIPGDRNGTNPDDKSWKEIMDQYDFDTISFEDGRPDFSEVSKGEVEIDDFSDNRRKNFVQADEKLAEQKGCQASEVRQWRTDNKYTWHEEADCKTMLKVPSEVHGNIPHDGGISEMKNQKDEQGQGKEGAYV